METLSSEFIDKEFENPLKKYVRRGPEKVIRSYVSYTRREDKLNFCQKRIRIRYWKFPRLLNSKRNIRKLVEDDNNIYINWIMKSCIQKCRECALRVSILMRYWGMKMLFPLPENPINVQWIQWALSNSSRETHLYNEDAQRRPTRSHNERCALLARVNRDLILLQQLLG